MDRVTVFNPQVAQQAVAIDAARRPGTLKDAVVGFVDNSKLNADRFIERLQCLLQERYRDQGRDQGAQTRAQGRVERARPGGAREVRGGSAMLRRLRNVYVRQRR